MVRFNIIVSKAFTITFAQPQHCCCQVLDFLLLDLVRFNISISKVLCFLLQNLIRFYIAVVNKLGCFLKKCGQNQRCCLQNVRFFTKKLVRFKIFVQKILVVLLKRLVRIKIAFRKILGFLLKMSSDSTLLLANFCGLTKSFSQIEECCLKSLSFLSQYSFRLNIAVTHLNKKRVLFQMEVIKVFSFLQEKFNTEILKSLCFLLQNLVRFSISVSIF